MVLARFSMVLPTVPMVLGWFSSMALARSPMDLLKFSMVLPRFPMVFS